MSPRRAAAFAQRRRGRGGRGLASGLWIIRGPGPHGLRRMVRKWRLRTIAAPIPPACRRRSRKRASSSAARIWRAAADCMVCHTAQGGKEYAGGLAFKLPFGTLYSTNITPDKETGIGNYSDQDFLDARASRHPPRWRAALSGDAVHVLHLYDRRRCAGDQGLSVQPAAGARGRARRIR